MPDAPPADPVAFLDEEANRSLAALRHTFGEFKALFTPSAAPHPGSSGAGAGGPGGLHALVGEHPFAALGGGAAAGFLAASLLVPSKEQQALKRLAALERAIALHGPDTVKPRPGRGLSGALLDALVGVVKPAILHTHTAALAARTVATATEREVHHGPEPRG